MPRPGTDVYLLDDAPAGGPSLDTGQAFMVGAAARGDNTKVTQIRSMRQYETLFGPRSGGSLLYDGASGFFAEGGNVLNLVRCAGSGLAKSTIAFGGFTANAITPGAWGNSLSLKALAPQIAGPAGAFVIQVLNGTTEVERSPMLSTADGVLAWQLTSQYVRLVGTSASALPVVPTTAALAGGADGAAPTDVELAIGLALFTWDLGPGQVLAPGFTTLAAQTAVMAHADLMKRNALVDLPDTATVGTLMSAVTALYALKGARLTAAVGPWAVYPGAASPATVTIPYSGVQAGLLARSDAKGNPNVPAAGVNGISRAALALSQVYSDADREALNSAGVTLAKPRYGSVRTYGGRSVSGPTDVNWLWFANARVLNAIAHEADAIAENYVLRQIDGRRQLFAAFESELNGLLLRYFNSGALYGATPVDAFVVDTSDKINTVQTIMAGEVHAAIYAKVSPSAEYVRIDITKTQLDRTLPNPGVVAA